MHETQYLQNQSLYFNLINTMLFALGITITLYGFKIANKNKTVILFFIYLLTNSILYFISAFITKTIKSPAITSAQLIELGVYILFFYSLEKKRMSRIALLLCYFIFLGLQLAILINHNYNFKLLSLYANELLRLFYLTLLISLAIGHIIRFLKLPNQKELILHSATITILFGLILYSGLTISITLLTSSLPINSSAEYQLLTLPFYINLLFIKKSILCNSLVSI